MIKIEKKKIFICVLCAILMLSPLALCAHASPAPMRSDEFCQRLIDTAENKKTLYVMGGYGTTLNEVGKQYSFSSYPQYNMRQDRMVKILGADNETFGFDCVCLIKGILWGFDGDPTKKFGGAVYGSNNVPDLNCEQMINSCKDKNGDFSNIEPGEIVYMPGHVGVYVGNGYVVESTPSMKDGTQKTKLTQRPWTQHGHLPFVEYVDDTPEPEPSEKTDIEALAEQAIVVERELTKLIMMIAEMGGGQG